MKKLAFVCLILAVSVSVVFSQNTVNQTDANGRKQGLWDEKSPGISSKGYYVNNQKDGCWTTYTSDEKLIRIENFKLGIRDGIAVDIDQHGYLVSEVYYMNNLLEGTVRKYFYGSNPASFIDFHEGKMHGKKKIYYENSAGKLLEESDYKDDVKNGKSNFYSLTGEPIAEYNYVNNLLQGMQKTYYSGRKIMSEQQFVDNLENGFSKEYYENGKLKSEGLYVKGILNGMWKDYDEAGHLKMQGNYVNGEKDGKWQEFDLSGKVVKTTVFNKGQAK